MARNKSYITILNELWEVRRKHPEGLSNEAAMLYLCLLDLFNRGGNGRFWPGEITLSDYEMAKVTKLRRQSLPRYRTELATCGLLEFEHSNKGRGAATKYILAASKKATHSDGQGEINRPKMDYSSEEIGQKWTITTLYSIKDSYTKTSTTTPREGIVVEKPQKEISPEEAYRGFFARYFDQGRAAVLEQLCMNLKTTPDEFKRLARECIVEWMAAGEPHMDPTTGRFDERGAARHLVSHVRVKLAAARRERPKGKEEARNALIRNCLDSTNLAIEKERNQNRENRNGTDSNDNGRNGRD